MAEIKLRFSAAGLREITQGLKESGAEGTTTFEKITSSAAKANKQLTLTQAELQQVHKALSQVGSSSAAFDKVDSTMRLQNPYTRGLDRAHDVFIRRNLDRAAEEGGGVSNVLGAIGGPGGMAAAVGVGAAVVAFDKLKQAIEETGAEAQKLVTDAHEIGTSASTLKAWRVAFEEAGLDANVADTALKNITQRLGAMKTGIGNIRFKEVFRELNIPPETLGKMKTAEDLMVVLADRLKALSDPAAAFNFAKKLGLEDALPLLLEGGDALKHSLAEAGDSGRIAGDDVYEGLAKAHREMEAANDTMRTQLTMAFEPFDVAAANSMAKLASWIVELNRWIGRIAVMGANAAAAANRAPQEKLKRGDWLGALTDGAAAFVMDQIIPGASLFGGASAKPTPPVSAKSPGAPSGTVVTKAQLDAMKEIDKISAQLITHSEHRLEIEQHIKDIEQTLGHPIDAKIKSQWLAAASAEDAKPGQQKAQRSAKEQAAGERELAVERARLLDQNVHLVETENQIAEAREKGLKVPDAEARLANARAKDTADALKKSDEKTKAARDWQAVLSGTTKTDENYQKAEEAIAKAMEDGLSPTEEQILAVRTLGMARDRAAEAAKALARVQPLTAEATEYVSAGQKDPKTPQGDYDPRAAYQQWADDRLAIEARTEALIRQNADRAEQEEGASTVDIERQVGLDIAAMRVSMEMATAAKLLEIRQKALDQAKQKSEEQQASEKQHIDEAATNVGDAVMKLATGAKIGGVGTALAQQLLREILQTLLVDPLVKMIQSQMTAILAPQSQGGVGGPLGALGNLLFGGIGAGTGVTLPSGSLAAVSSSPTNLGYTGADMTGGYASGTTNATPGVHWVGEKGPELMYFGGGEGVLDHRDSTAWMSDLKSQALSRPQSGTSGGAGQSSTVLAPSYQINADGADPAQLQRAVNAFQAHAQNEPRRWAAYAKAAGLI